MMATGAVLGAGFGLPGTVFAGAGGNLLPSNSGMLGGDAVNVAKPEAVEGKNEKDGPEEGEPEPTVQVGGSRQFSSAILANQVSSPSPVPETVMWRHRLKTMLTHRGLMSPPSAPRAILSLTWA
jgi:hypothetical protein